MVQSSTSIDFESHFPQLCKSILEFNYDLDTLRDKKSKEANDEFYMKTVYQVMDSVSEELSKKLDP